MESANEIHKRYIQQLMEEERKELLENADLISNFKKICAVKGISLTDENFGYVQSIGIVATFPNIVSLLSSEVQKDKEGLVDFKLLDNLFEKRNFAEGYLYGEHYMLMAHPYFRRGYSKNANFAPRFIEMFWRLNEPQVDSYISIDYDRVRINVDNTMYMEADTWFGAKFDKEISNIPDGTSKLCPPMDLEDFHISFFFSNAYSLDIKWSSKGTIKTFQAEEFKTEEIKIIIDNIEYYPARYIHAEYDMEKKHFRHFDGAIHFYTSDEYYERRQSDFNYNSKNDLKIKTQSQKLFKLNGVVSIDKWIELTSHYFTGNPLIIEYFEGKYPTHINEVLETLKMKTKE